MNDAAAKPPKRAELLVAAIEQRIEREQLQPGASLGTEPVLMAQYGVSRETLRNAIRQLERHGVARMRRGGGGGGGGLVIEAAASQTAVHAITAHLEFSDIGWSEIVEARALIDIEAAVEASRRSDEFSAARLRQLTAELDRGSTVPREIARRHLALPTAIAELAANPVISLFSSALSDWTLDILPSELGSPELRDREMHLVNDILRELVEAIVRGDEAASRKAAEAFSARSIKVSQFIESRRRRTRVDEWFKTSRPDSDDKLAQRLALALAQDVAARGWPDERFGAEAELMDRFGVSRSIWREAIRLLEMHGIARPRRGRGGGLMIGRPDAAYTIDSARRYLRRAHLKQSHYLDMRSVLEAGAIGLAITRATEEEMIELKRLGKRLAQSDDSQTVAAAVNWHCHLSTLCGNRALSLLLRILLSLTQDPNANVPPAIAELLRQRHFKLSQAVVARDEAKAHRIAHEHFEWLQEMLDLQLGSLS